MIIDKEPQVNTANLTLEVASNIDISEEVLVFVNGLMGVTDEDITVNNNIITLDAALDIDIHNDVFIVMYTVL